MAKLSSSSSEPAAAADASTSSCAGGPLSSVIRSKGFAWLATHHQAAVYWSHAGTHFELKNVGTWWAAADVRTLPDGKLPDAVAGDFEGEFGDRRQEIVMIGVGMDRVAIEAALDACLLTDDEVAKYRQHFVAKQSPPPAAAPAS